MAAEAWASGHILCSHMEERNELLAKIKHLPASPYENPFSIWQGIFHAPLAPNRAGFIITFGLSHKYLGEPQAIGAFLSFWEEFIADLSAVELFIAMEQEFFWSNNTFGKFYFQWSREYDPASGNKDWVFQGQLPDDVWQSRFQVDLNDG